MEIANIHQKTSFQRHNKLEISLWLLPYWIPSFHHYLHMFFHAFELWKYLKYQRRIFQWMPEARKPKKQPFQYGKCERGKYALDVRLSPFAYKLNTEFWTQLFEKHFMFFLKSIFISTNDKSFLAIFDFSFSRIESKTISMFIWVQKFFVNLCTKFNFKLLKVLELSTQHLSIYRLGFELQSVGTAMG